MPHRKVVRAGERVVGRLVRKAVKPAGSAPGAVVYTGQQKVDKVRIRTLVFDEATLEEVTHDTIDSALASFDSQRVSWLNIDGLHEADVISAVGGKLGIHKLMLEDIVSTSQRPKVEDYAGAFLVIVKMISFDETTSKVEVEQVSFAMGDGWVVSFQERLGDVFEPVRERLRQTGRPIRTRKADYLAYALIDAIVDGYFRVLESIGNRIEDLEDAVLVDSSAEVMHQIHDLKREALILRRAVWPLRETLGSMYRGEIDGITEETQVFLRDVYDHSVQVIDTVESLRELLSATMDLYMSGVSNRMNEVMKVLTIIATIFIPLSFFAGLYGMNFEYMPELAVRWAYPTLLGFMFVVAIGMLMFFRKKGWL